MDPIKDADAYDKKIWNIKKEGGYDAAVARLATLDPYERKLENSSNGLGSFRSYLDFLHRSEDPLIQACRRGVVERLVEVHFLSVDAWTLLLQYSVCRFEVMLPFIQ